MMMMDDGDDAVVADDDCIYSTSMPLLSIAVYVSVGLTSCLVVHHSQPVSSPRYWL